MKSDIDFVWNMYGKNRNINVEWKNEWKSKNDLLRYNVEKDERKSWYDVLDESPVERVDDVELFLREWAILVRLYKK